LPTATERIALIGQGGATYLTSSNGTRVADARSFSPQWSTSDSGQPVLAEPSGPVVIHDASTGMLRRYDSSGLLDSEGGFPTRPTCADDQCLAVTPSGLQLRTSSLRYASRYDPFINGDASRQARVSHPGRGVFVKSHELYLLGVAHASIRLTPSNPTKWLAERSDLFNTSQRDEFDNVYATIGAGPPNGDTTWACLVNSVLRSDTNRDGDLNEPATSLWRIPFLRNMTIPGSTNVGEDALVELLLRWDASFHDDVLVYECIPDDSNEFNSNSYLSGLLSVAALPYPSWIRAAGSFRLSFPGWSKPVPAIYFQP
jgi:hypothetical protein